MPVSRTKKSIRPIASPPVLRDMVRLTSPCSVNLMPFMSRLRSTCRRRAMSPTTVSGSAGSNTRPSASPFSSARDETIFTDSSAHCLRGKAECSSFICPASIFEKSRTPLMMASNASPLLRIVRSNSLVSAPPGSSSTTSESPMMAFSGVRISWLILARNSLLAALADSARAVACSSSRTAIFLRIRPR